MKRLGYWVCFLLLMLTGCLRHDRVPRPSTAAPKQEHPEYVDVQDGWTIRVVIPTLKSGGYILPSLAAEGSGNSTEINGDDFVGYERADYKVVPSRENGHFIQLIHCEAWADNKKKGCRAPSRDIFQQLQNARYLRMVYLTRVSRADHDAAIIASNDLQTLNTLTRTVTDEAECGSTSTGRCTLIPKGISVNPEPGKSRR